MTPDQIAAGAEALFQAEVSGRQRGLISLAYPLARYGHGLRAGDTLLSGSFIRPVEAPAGSRFDANFGPFGHITLNFA